MKCFFDILAVKPHTCVMFFSIGLITSTALRAEIDWTFSHNLGANSFSDSVNSNESTFSGTLNLTPTGFLKKTYTSSSGSHAIANGSVRFGLEVPGFFYFQEPTLAAENQLIYAVDAGTCPSSNANHVFLFGQWPGNTDTSNAAQAAFGKTSWNQSLGKLSIDSIFNLSGFNSPSWFSSAVELEGTCSDGVMDIDGIGDRGGRVYFTSGEGMVYRTNANRTIVAVKQTTIPSKNYLAGRYRAFRYDQGDSSVPVRPFDFTIGRFGSDGSGSAYIDPSSDGNLNTTFSESIEVSSINNPINGVFSGSITNSAQTGNIACAVSTTSKLVLLCAGQSPGATQKPLNFIAVSVNSPPNTFASHRGFNGMVQRIERSTLGRTWAQGFFSSYNNSLRNDIALINSDGSLATEFNPGSGFNSSVYDFLEVTDGSGDVYVSGAFNQYNGTAATYLVRLKTDGSINTSFDISSHGPNSSVFSMRHALDTSGDLLISGFFFNYGGSSRKRVARIHSDGSLDTSFDSSNGADDLVRTVSVATDGKVYITGNFENYGGTAINKIARLLPTGALDTSFFAGTGIDKGTISNLLPLTDGSGDVFIFGTQFTSFNGTEVPNMARLNDDGTIDTTSFSLSGGPSGSVSKMEYATDGSGELIVAGDFGYFNGLARPGIVRILTDGTISTEFTSPSSFSHGVLDFIQQTHSFYLGGSIYSYENIGVDHFLKIKSDGQLNKDFGIGYDHGGHSGYVYQIIEDKANPGKFYASGTFDTDSMAPSKFLVRFDSSGSFDTSFSCPSGGTNRYLLSSLSESDGTLFVGGSFEAVSGNYSVDAAKLGSDGCFAGSFAFGIPGGLWVNSIVKNSVDSNQIYFAGNLVSYDGHPIDDIARVNVDGTLDTSFSVQGTGFSRAYNYSSVVYTLLPSTDGKLYAGGSFNLVDGTNTGNLVRFNSDGSLDSTFNPQCLGSVLREIQEVGDGSGDIFVAGAIYSCNATSVHDIVRITSDGNLNTIFNTSNLGISGGSIITFDKARDGSGDVFIGGNFHTVGGSLRQKIARLNSDGTLDTGFNPGTGFDRDVYSIKADSDGNIWVGTGSKFYNGTSIDMLVKIDGSGNVLARPGY